MRTLCGLGCVGYQQTMKGICTCVALMFHQGRQLDIKEVTEGT